jgi:hypothetical protein
LLPGSLCCLFSSSFSAMAALALQVLHSSTGQETVEHITGQLADAAVVVWSASLCRRGAGMCHTWPAVAGCPFCFPLVTLAALVHLRKRVNRAAGRTLSNRCSHCTGPCVLCCDAQTLQLHGGCLGLQIALYANVLFYVSVPRMAPDKRHTGSQQDVHPTHTCGCCRCHHHVAEVHACVMPGTFLLWLNIVLLSLCSSGAAAPLAAACVAGAAAAAQAARRGGSDVAARAC